MKSGSNKRIVTLNVYSIIYVPSERSTSSDGHKLTEELFYVSQSQSHNCAIESHTILINCEPAGWAS